MASHEPVKLTFPEKLHLVAAIPKILATFAVNLVVRTLFVWPPPLTRRAFARVLLACFVRGMDVLTVRQKRALGPATTGDKVRAFCAAHALPLESVRLEDTDGFQPATLHFVDLSGLAGGAQGGGSSAVSKRIFLYFHGGGYTAALFGLDLGLREAQAAHASLLAVLEYTLAPECKYPGQLAQAGAALRYLLQHRGASYADIILGGESAGGNLTLALLAHMQKPKPGITPLPATSPGDGNSKLRGVLAVSPRTRNDGLAASFAANKWRDAVDSSSVATIAANWAPLDEVWAAADLGDKEFWKGLRAEQMLLVAGGAEAYRDDIVHTAGTMIAATSADAAPGSNTASSIVQLVVCPGEAHVQCGADMMLGIEDGYMMQAVMSWLESLTP